MSASVNEDLSSPLSDVQSVLDQTVSKSSSRDSLDNCSKVSPVEAGQSDGNAAASEPTTPKPNPMAFTIDFGDSRKFDRSKLEELAKKSQARHQRVQSMSASMTKPNPATQKPPMSAKLPRKAQGYNSEGYFSSDQEDSCLSGSVKLRQSPLAQNTDRRHITSPIMNRHLKSPLHDSFTLKRMSKSPIVDSIMSRSDILPSRQSLNLPLKNPNSSYLRDVNRTPSYGNLSSSYQPRSTMADIIDQSPEAVMLTDISSPELDILTPDNGLSTPDGPNSPRHAKGRRAVSETPDLLFKKCPVNSEPLYIDDDIDRQSNNSSTGTYTIEADTYTAEQKARMSIDRTFGTEVLSKTIDDALKTRGISSERDPELIYDHSRFIHEVPTRDTTKRSPLVQSKTFDYPMKQSKDKNVLEISCCYDSPTEHDLAAQTSKQIKSTRSYLEKIKNRVRTITEKSFPKQPKEEDVGNFTSVTTSGVLSTKSAPKVIEYHNHRRCSLTKSEIDQTDYVHRLSRESSVPVSLPSNKLLLEEARFESTALRNAHKAVRDDSGVSSDITPEQVVGKLSYLSLNRCKGDKTWIQEWAESVKKYNNHTLADNTFTLDDERPPMSPRRENVNKYAAPRSVYSPAGTPTKIPSPVPSVHHRLTPDLIPSAHDTEAYLQKTQSAITNLQAKLHTRTNHITNIPPVLTTSVLSDKTASSRLPVSTLSRSNSLNYRLRPKETSSDNSPLRSPGNYLITGSTKVPQGRLLINNASRSLETDGRRDSNMNSPTSDRGLHSNSSDDKTLSNKQSDVRKTHVRHRSFDGRTHDFGPDLSNANTTVCLKTVLKNNAEAQNLYPRIEQTRCLGDGHRGHQRVYSDGLDKPLKTLYGPNNIAFGSSIKRSSSFSTVTKNNNFMDQRISNSRRSSGHSDFHVENDVVDYPSDESEQSIEKSQESRYKRPVARTRIDSPDLKSIAPANSPRLCPNTPEMQRKFAPGLVRNSVRVTNKERGLNSRLSEPPIAREVRAKPANHQSRRISEPTRQAVLNRLTKSRSSTREFQPKSREKGNKKPTQHRSSSALASKELEFTNWKKRASYDPMKAAQEDRKRRQQMASAKRLECNKDDLSSPSHSSPVHRSQSFHTTNIADLEALEYSSEGTEEDQMLTLPMDNPMITSTHSDILDLRRTEPRDLRRKAVNNDVVLTRDYVAGFQVNQPAERPKRLTADSDKRKTYLVDDVTPTRENVDFLKSDTAVDKRKTFILDSDTNSTTNGSSPRNSSIFSHEKNSMTTGFFTGTSDTEGESGTESAPVVMRHPAGKRTAKELANPKHRYSGDYSMSSSTTSVANKKPIQPRYLDISKYKNETSPKTFLRRDPSKTYVGVLNHGERAGSVSKGSAQHYEMEQKKQELEKWKRRASYDPRKSAAQARGKPAPKTASSVLRSQSFHGPVLASTQLRYQPPTFIAETYDASSDNDF